MNSRDALKWADELITELQGNREAPGLRDALEDHREWVRGCIARTLLQAQDDDEGRAVRITIDKEECWARLREDVLRSMGGVGGLSQSFLNSFVMKATEAKTRACPKCGAVAGEWCKDNPAKVCRERLS